MSRPYTARTEHEGPIMPPLIYETVAWLRFYSPIPFPPLPGEELAAAAPDPAKSAHAAPIAGAVIGLAAGLVLAIAAALGASAFVAAAAGVLALIVFTGGRGEQALEAAADRSGEARTGIVRYGIAAIAFAVLLRTGALDGLLAYGGWSTAFALAGACAVARAAAIGFTLLRPAEGATAAEPAALQWLAISGLAIGIAAVMPFLGLGAAIAGIAAAAGAVALVSAFQPRDTSREFAAIAEPVAEIAFLLAVLAFASSS